MHAEAGAGKESAELKKQMATKEHELRQHEAEIERRQKEVREKHERELAVLTADKKVAIASTKLKAIEDALEEEQLGEKVELLDIPIIKNEDRTFAWVNSPTNKHITAVKTNATEGNTPQNGMPDRTTPGKPQCQRARSIVCLNYPNAIQPITAKLPPGLRAKWEKEIAKYSERNGDSYPGFHVFSGVIKKHARIRNNPNINIVATFSAPVTPTPSQRLVRGQIKAKGLLR